MRTQVFAPYRMHPKVRRLLSDCRSVEQAYVKKTGIFPMMHVVAIGRVQVAEVANRSSDPVVRIVVQDGEEVVEVFR